MKLLSRNLLGLSLLTFCFQLQAQDVKEDNQDLFNDVLYRQGNVYRTASGKPGPEYWQNRADYEIEAELDDVNHTLTGKITITYTNNSPEQLDFIWLYLEQNRFTEDSRGTLTTPTWPCQLSVKL